MSDNCSACKNIITKLISVCKTPLCDLYTNRKNKLKAIYPLDIYFCSKCHLIQLKNIIKPDNIYKNYLYKSSHSFGLKKHFREYAKKIISLGYVKQNSRILDIGCNDGILLNFFKTQKINVAGIDPAPNIVVECKRKNIPLINDYFNDKVVGKLTDEKKIYDIIFANNVLANVPDLKNFFQNINKILSKDGTFIFETINGPNLIKDLQIDMLNNEHIYYFSVSAVKKISNLYNFKLINVEKVKSKGGSYRFYIKKKNSNLKIKKSYQNKIDNIIKHEKSEGFLNKKKIAKMNNNFKKNKEKFVSFLKKLNINNLFAYGASGPATSLIYFYNLEDKIDYLVDDNPQRVGRYSPSSSIKVIDSKKMLEKMPEYVIILAWRFAKKIILRNKDFINKGGKFICILPKIKIIQKKNI